MWPTPDIAALLRTLSGLIGPSTQHPTQALAVLSAVLLLLGCLAMAAAALRPQLPLRDASAESQSSSHVIDDERGNSPARCDADTSFAGGDHDQKPRSLIAGWILWGLLLWPLSLGCCMWILAAWEQATPLHATALWLGAGMVLLLSAALQRRRKSLGPPKRRDDRRSTRRRFNTRSWHLARRSVFAWLGLATAVLVGLWLRWPPTDVSLAGRDQGSYALIARSIELRGSWRLHDEVLVAAHERKARGLPADDILGLYPGPTDAWRGERYEGAYRPGAYLVSGAHGKVVPQFLPLYPSVLAASRIIAGDLGPPLTLALLAALSILSVASTLCWWTGHRSWGIAAALALALTPVMIWLQRTTLSETLTLPCVLVACTLWSEPGASRRKASSIATLLIAAAAVRLSFWALAPAVLWCLSVLGDDPNESSTGFETRRNEPVPLRIAPPIDAIITSLALALVTGACAWSSFPYVHDELARILGSYAPTTPLGVAALGSLAALLLFTATPMAVLLRRLLPELRARLAAVALTQLAILAFALAYWLSSRAPEAPWSRLEGWIALPPLCFALAVIGALRAWTLLGPQHGDKQDQMPGSAGGYLALLMLPCISVLLFSNRVLPTFGLWYHGRYLASEVYPALLLLGGLGAAWLESHLDIVPKKRSTRLSPDESSKLHQAKENRAGVRRFAQTAFVVSCGLGVVAPNATLTEMEGARPAIALLSERVSRNSVVIAGGEGWHYHHAFNQVGGALAFGSDAVVIPYRDKESAYATMWSLMVDLEPSTDERARDPRGSVFLLLNEASHDLEDPRLLNARLSGLDDELIAPFSAKRVDLIDLTVHRLTPSRDYWRRPVTRDGLSLALVELAVEPELLARVERWEPISTPALQAVPRAGQVHRSILQPYQSPANDSQNLRTGAASALCAQPGTPLELAVPGDASVEPLSAAIVLAGESLALEDEVEIAFEIAGAWHPVSPRLSGPPRRRDTLGPWLLPGRPTAMRVSTGAYARRTGPCPEGLAVRELRLAPLVAGALEAEQIETHRIVPPPLFDTPVPDRSWAPARVVTKRRPGPGSRPKSEGENMRLDAGTRYDFEALRSPSRPRDSAMPEGRNSSRLCDLVVHLTDTGDLREPVLEISINGILQPSIPLPSKRRRTWSSDRIEVDCTEPLLKISALVRDAAANPLADRTVGSAVSSSGSVLVRDIAVFSRRRAQARQDQASEPSSVSPP